MKSSKGERGENRRNEENKRRREGGERKSCRIGMTHRIHYDDVTFE